MLDLRREGPVFVLRMTSGENVMNRAFVAAWSAALDEVEGADGPAALVSTGAERFYSTGLDLAGFAGDWGGEGEYTLAGLARLWARLLSFPVATVAALNGHAYAAGAMLALAHDFRVMRADRGFFCLPEIDLGMGAPLTPAMYALISTKLERGLFHRMLVSGHRYGGEEAAGAGIVDEAAAEAQVLPRALEIAEGLAGRDRATMAALKEGLHADALALLRGA